MTVHSIGLRRDEEAPAGLRRLKRNSDPSHSRVQGEHYESESFGKCSHTWW